MRTGRLFIAVALPFCVLFGFSSILVREIGNAFKYAWLEARSEIDAAKREWRAPTRSQL